MKCGSFCTRLYLAKLLNRYRPKYQWARCSEPTVMTVSQKWDRFYPLSKSLYQEWVSVFDKSKLPGETNYNLIKRQRRTRHPSTTFKIIKHSFEKSAKLLAAFQRRPKIKSSFWNFQKWRHRVGHRQRQFKQNADRMPQWNRGQHFCMVLSVFYNLPLK